MSPIYRATDGVLYINGERFDQYVNRSLDEFGQAIADATENLRALSVAAQSMDPKLPKTHSKGHWRDVVPRSIRGTKD